MVVGYAANIYIPQVVRGGAVGIILVSIFGAVLGGFMAQTLFGISLTSFDMNSLIIAVSGSVGLLTLGKALSVNSESYD